MEQLPILVEDLAIRDLSNAVCVATYKFTNDQFAAAFDPDENPAPAPGQPGTDDMNCLA